MCRIPKIVVVAPDDVGPNLRRMLSSLEYEIVAAVTSLEQTQAITADVAVLWKPDEETIAGARARGLKTVAIGGQTGADLSLDEDSASDLKTRVWELFRPA